MKQTKISFNLDGLEDISRKVGSMRTRVGVIGSKAAQSHLLDSKGVGNPRGGKSYINNATLALIQIFGSLTRNIPARDFLLMPIMKKRRELIQSLQTGSMRDAFMKGDYKKMMELLGVKAEEIVQQAFETSGFGSWAPNKPATIAAKGSSAPLINTAQLRKSVSSDVVGDSSRQAALTAQSAGTT